jgi:hypothetical protein
LKMEPREAAILPVPQPSILQKAWTLLKPEKARLERALAKGLWTGVAKHVDEALLHHACGMPRHEVAGLHVAGRELRTARMRRVETSR